MSACLKVAGFAKKAAPPMGWSAGESLLQRSVSGSDRHGLKAWETVRLMKRVCGFVVNCLYSVACICVVLDLMRFAYGFGRIGSAIEGAGGVRGGSADLYINALLRMRILGQRVSSDRFLQSSRLIHNFQKKRAHGALEVGA